MIKKTGMIVMLAVVCSAFAAAAQTQKVLGLMLLPDTREENQAQTYLTPKKDTDIIRVNWVQTLPVGAFRSARVYYSRLRQDADLSKYDTVKVMIDNNAVDRVPSGVGTQTHETRMIRFRPGDNGIAPGTYYCIVAFTEGGVTYHSPAFDIMVTNPVAPVMVSPVANIPTGTALIDDYTPVFSWTPVEGVPYYHVVLSDERLPVKELVDNNDSVFLKLNMIWQAITPNTRIAYGSPDPSGTITALPPPLSAGKEYSWLVFNNYGGQLAHSDGNAWGVPAMFTIRAPANPVRAPRIVSPPDGKVIQGDDIIKFQWTNLDARANSYLVNVFMYIDADKLGFGALDSHKGEHATTMLIWETTVAAPAGIRQSDTLAAELRNARGTLTGGEYVWRVYARESNGAATTGEASAGEFEYVGVPSGSVSVTTMEVIGDGLQSRVGLVELKTEVVSGPMQAPFAFFTNERGQITRELPAGTYRVTAIKESYNPTTVTFSVTDPAMGATAPVTVQMRRPDGTIYGRTVDAAGEPVNQVKVTAVSGSDTVTAATDGNGYFTLSCKEASWIVTMEKAGFANPRFRAVNLYTGTDENIGVVTLVRNTQTLSGTVRNTMGAAILGVRVKVFRDGALVDELASTPQSGAFSFMLPPGSYTVTAEMPGFAMFSRNIVFTGTANFDITLAENAAMVNGSIFGRSWNAGKGAFEVSPIPGARVMFVSSPSPGVFDTLTVTSDATFGKFSMSVPGGRAFTVVSEAAGFITIANRPPSTVETESGRTIIFDKDTLQALAMISGRARGEAKDSWMGDVDVSVYDPAAKRNVAVGKTNIDGRFELRNIPDGSFTVNAGKTGYYLNVESPVGLAVTEGIPVFSNGHPENNLELEMAAGLKTITWNIQRYRGSGLVRILSPLTRTLRFGAGANPSVSLQDAGPGDYVVEAIAESDTALLRLAYRKFNVPGDESVSQTDNIVFRFSHAQPDSIGLTGHSGDTVLSVYAEVIDGERLDSLELFYRSEGGSRYERTVVKAVDGAIGPSVTVKPARDGCYLYYYFRIYMSSGDIYGSEGQIFRSYVKPVVTSISRLSVNPGASGETLRMPSSYEAEFALSAFYSDLYELVGAAVNIGRVSWSVLPQLSGGPRIAGTRGISMREATLSTGTVSDTSTLFQLVAALNPSGSGYTVRSQRDTVRIPFKVSGKALATITVRRSGDELPIRNTEKANFHANAYDEDGRPVTVSPVWELTPAVAGAMVSGEFAPAPGFFGTVNVTASAYRTGSTGQIRAAYKEAASQRPGLIVTHVMRGREGAGGDTADTKRGLKVAFPAGSHPVGQSVELKAEVLPEPKNSVKKGGSGLRMADSLSYILEFARSERIYGNTDIYISIDIPPHLRQNAEKNRDDFKIARWYPDSSRWIALPSSEVTGAGTAVAARLSRSADDIKNNTVAKNAAGKTSSKTRKAKAANDAAAPASQLHTTAQEYALVTGSGSMSVNFTVSPNPFSPYIRPVREYGKDYSDSRNIPTGTCIKINVEAREEYDIRSLKVHIYNATGKRVWAVELLGSDVAVGGENRIWWDGRTTAREEVWDENFHERNKSRGRMLRNGRYFVTVILTNVEGKQKRAMKQVVLMK